MAVGESGPISAAVGDHGHVPKEAPTRITNERDDETKAAGVQGHEVEEDELAGTRLLFRRDLVTGQYDENIILSPTPTKSPSKLPDHIRSWASTDLIATYRRPIELGIMAEDMARVPCTLYHRFHCGHSERRWIRGRCIAERTRDSLLRCEHGSRSAVHRDRLLDLVRIPDAYPLWTASSVLCVLNLVYRG